jgi:hypothetical protein
MSDLFPGRATYFMNGYPGFSNAYTHEEPMQDAGDELVPYPGSAY